MAGVTPTKGVSREVAAIRRRFSTHVSLETATAGHGHALCWGWMQKRVCHTCFAVLRAGTLAMLHAALWSLCTLHLLIFMS